jgi:hypothetical protein
MAAALAAGLAWGTFNAPAGGEPLFLSLLFAIGAAVAIGAPLILTGERVLETARVDLLPFPPFDRWMLRTLFGNPLRTLVVAIVLVWSAATFGSSAGGAGASWLHVAQAAAWLFLAVTLSQLLEDVIRYRRDVVLHQLLFFAALAVWPLALDFLGEPANFVPPPAWARGPVEGLLLGASGPPAVKALALTLPLLLGALLVRADAVFVRRASSKQLPPAAGVAWTGWVARALARPFGGDASLVKELLVPLRFLFLRMSLVFVFLVVAAALVFGIPYLMLSIVFWWQPLSTNALGPDLEGGTTRYQLLGWSPRGVLLRRTAAIVLFTLAIAFLAGALCAALGIARRPTIGPDAWAAYPIAFAYSLSLVPLWAMAGERYSLRFSDPLEMHTLLPERKRSGGARAVLVLLAGWLGVSLLMVAVLGLLYVASVPLTPGIALEDRLTLIVLSGAAVNIFLYTAHIRRFRPVWHV